MADLRQVRLAQRDKVAAEGIAAMATRQHGVVSSTQLQKAGLSRAAISRWAASARLYRIHPRVYALGHSSLSLRGRLWAALLYAGPGAAFSHTTAAWLWELIDAEPRLIHLTVPGRRLSLPDVRVHHSREVDALQCRGLPVTPVPRTLLDLAGVIPARQLRRVLSEADYRALLDADDTAAVLRRGRPGSRQLRRALADHLPQLARTLSELEQRFLELCESAGISLPEVNATVGRMRIDALWRDKRLAVELDGVAAHGGSAFIKRDRDREMALRAEGFRVVRYSWHQVTRRSDEVVADLRRLLEQ
jgi:predicted transcriptional regulator of viral defense system